MCGFRERLGAPQLMPWGKPLLLAMGMAVCFQAALLAGEPAGAHDHGEAAGLTSLRKNAIISIGGEVRVDYSYRHTTTTATSSPPSTYNADTSVGDLSLRNANLRLQADVHPNIRAFFKVDLSSQECRRDDILEEALLIMNAVGGSGLGLFAGKGRAPYGQDITLGMIQSYNHTANAIDTSEGRVFIVDPPESRSNPANPGRYSATGPMRPGQIDRAVQAGVSYDWDDRWRVELAVFKPSDYDYKDRLIDSKRCDSASDIGVAARIWWRPVEELVVQASGMMNRSNDMGRPELRTDLEPGARGRKQAYAVSLGFDYTRGPWRIFGEYQHGWDWNFTSGYDTDTWQIGAAREFGEGWRVGAMAEGLHIDDKKDVKVTDDYYKLALNVRYTFSSGFFVLAEYGHEWMRRERDGSLAEKRRGDFFGMRVGLSF